VVRVGEEVARSEDGAVERRFPRINGAYLLAADHPSVAWAAEVVASARSGARPDVATWWFATDAPYLATMGAPVLGLGPGDPELAHTTREALPVDELVAAVADYRALATAFLRGHVPWEDPMTAPAKARA
jgi:acetylornithine deacetylase/succinyl-diaminopimelate desuccinylase-like protein